VANVVRSLRRRNARRGRDYADACGCPVATRTLTPELQASDSCCRRCLHSMDIAAAVGARRLREIMTEVVQPLLEVVSDTAARSTEFTVTGIMEVVGAPIALEDTRSVLPGLHGIFRKGRAGLLPRRGAATT